MIKGVTAEVLAIEDLSTVKTTTEEEALKSGKFQVIGKEIDDKYIAQVKAQVVNQEAINRMQKDITIVYTASRNRKYPGPPRYERDRLPRMSMLCRSRNFRTEISRPSATRIRKLPEAFELGLKLAKEKNADLVLCNGP